MAKKLGEILLEKGVIGPRELKKALDAQLIFGGKLGTNLIEFGFVDEAVLTSALEEQKSTEVASPKLFETIPHNVIRMIPKSLVKRHFIIPLSADDKTITVAVSDPNDLVVLDEITFVTGRQVRALISPEARLLEAMESYYGLARPSRYVTLSDEIQKQMHGELSSIAETSGQAPAPAERWAVEMGRQDTPESELILNAVEAAHEEGASEDQRRAVQETLGQLQQQQAAARDAHAQAAREEPPLSLDEAGERLSRIEIRDEIGDVLLDYGAPRFDRTAVFILQKARTLGWNACGENASHERMRGLLIPKDQPSIFDSLTSGSKYFLGEVEDIPGNELLLQALGGGKPEVAFLMPISFQDRLIAAFYADGSMEKLRQLDVQAQRALAKKAGLAMEMLLIRNRILQ